MQKPPTCPCCFNVFALKDSSRHHGVRQPLLLDCGHSHCENCLYKLVKSRDSTRSITCCVCQYITPIVHDTLVDDLHADIYTNGMLHFTRQSLLDSGLSRLVPAGQIKALKNKTKETRNSASANFICRECLKSVATCRCVKCGCVYCGKCFDKIHSRSNTLREHQAVPIEDNFKQPLPGLWCSVHDNRMLEYFCEDDNVLICSRCYITGDHKGHTITSLEEKNSVLHGPLEEALKVAKNVERFLKKTKKTLSRSDPDYNPEINKMVSDVKDHFRFMHAQLQLRESAVIGQIRNSYQAGMVATQSMREDVNSSLEKLRNVITDAQTVLSNNTDVVLNAQCILEQLQAAKDIPCTVIEKNSSAPNVSWSVDESFLDIIKAYGDVTGSADVKMGLCSLSEVGEDYMDGTSETESVVSSSAVDTASDIVIEDEQEINIADNDSIASSSRLSRQASSSSGDKNLLIRSRVANIIRQISSGTVHKESVIVSHIRNPCHFLVQRCNDLTQLINLQKSITAACKSPPAKAEIPKTFEVGKVVLCKYSEDNHWYRVRVKNVIRDSQLDGGDDRLISELEVTYFDYGNTEVVKPGSHLRNMQQKFMKHPDFAVECCLHDIQPRSQDGVWSVEAIHAFAKMTNNSSSKTLYMTTISEAGGILQIDLSKPPVEEIADDRPVSVRDALVFLDLATFISNKPVAADGGRHASQRRVFVRNPQKRTNDVFDAIITHVDSPGSFCIQECGHHNDFLAIMMEEMQETYNAEDGEKWSIICPEIGMICAVRFSADNRWYRAEVIAMPGSQMVDICYSDYGNTELVAYWRLRKIVDTFIICPVQAIKCSLANVVPVDATWSTQALEFFVKKVSDKKVSIKVLNADENFLSVTVNIELNNKKKMVSLNSELVKRNFAQSTKRGSKAAGQSVSEKLELLLQKREKRREIISQDQDQTLTADEHDDNSVLKDSSFVDGSTDTGAESDMLIDFSDKPSQDNKVAIVSSPQKDKSIVTNVTDYVIMNRHSTTVVDNLIDLSDSSESLVLADSGDGNGNADPEAPLISLSTISSDSTQVTSVTDSSTNAANGLSSSTQASTVELVSLSNNKSWADDSDDFYGLPVDAASSSTTSATKIAATVVSSRAVRGVKREQKIARSNGIASELNDQMYDLPSPASSKSVNTTPGAASRSMTAKTAAASRNATVSPASGSRSATASPAAGSRNAAASPAASSLHATERPVVDSIVDSKHATTSLAVASGSLKDVNTPDRGKPSYRGKKNDKVKTSATRPKSNKNQIEYNRIKVTNYQSPNLFYIQLASSDGLQELIDGMQDIYDDTVPSLHMWKIGEYCAAKIDSKWFRATIETILHKTLVTVFLVDFGTQHHLQAVNIRKLTKEFFTQRQFCQKCHIADVSPAGDCYKWSQTATEYVEEQLAKTCSYLNNGEKDDQNSQPIDVIIEVDIPETALMPAKKDMYSLSERLKYKGLAIPVSRRPRRPLEQSHDGRPASVPPSILNVPQATISSVKKNIPSADLAQKPPAPVLVYKPPAIVERRRMQVVPTFVDEDATIFAQIVCTENEAAILSLNEVMQRYFNTKTTPSYMQPVQWMEGQACAAFFKSDGIWARAKVTRVLSERILVQYIEYGNSEWHYPERLRADVQEFIDVPQLTLEMVLYSIVPLNKEESSWPLNSLDYLHEKVVGHACTVIVQTDPVLGDPLKVSLMTDTGDDMTDLLCQRSMAIRVIDMFQIVKQSDTIRAVRENYKTYKQGPLPPLNHMSPVCITHMELPDVVYFQARIQDIDASCTPTLRSYIQEANAQLEELEKMATSLNGYAEKARRLSTVQRGTPCFAQFSHDACWYRAIIISTDDKKQQAFVQFVDYGNSEYTHYEKLSVLPAPFMLLPAQASRYRIANLLPPAGSKEWCEETLIAMGAAVKSPNIMICLKRLTPELTGEIYTINEATSDIRLVADLLVERGLAQLRAETLLESGLKLGQDVVDGDLPNVPETADVPPEAADVPRGACRFPETSTESKNEPRILDMVTADVIIEEAVEVEKSSLPLPAETQKDVESEEEDDDDEDDDWSTTEDDTEDIEDRKKKQLDKSTDE